MACYDNELLDDTYQYTIIHFSTPIHPPSYLRHSIYPPSPHHYSTTPLASKVLTGGICPKPDPSFPSFFPSSPFIPLPAFLSSTCLLIINKISLFLHLSGGLLYGSFLRPTVCAHSPAPLVSIPTAWTLSFGFSSPGAPPG